MQQGYPVPHCATYVSESFEYTPHPHAACPQVSTYDVHGSAEPASSSEPLAEPLALLELPLLLLVVPLEDPGTGQSAAVSAQVSVSAQQAG